jgi:hypothetical protein
MYLCVRERGRKGEHVCVRVFASDHVRLRVCVRMRVCTHLQPVHTHTQRYMGEWLDGKAHGIGIRASKEWEYHGLWVEGVQVSCRC